MRSNFITLLAALIVAVGCSKPESGADEHGQNPEPPATTSYFKATINDCYLQGPDDTGISIMVETNMPESEWSVETDSDWIAVTLKSDEIILVPETIEQDQTFPAPREGNITVKAGTVFCKSFKMIQEAWTRINAVSKIELSPSGESVEIPVSHNCYSWTASCSATWITVKKEDTSTLIITTSARNAGDGGKRSATVTLQSDRDCQTFTNITVSDADATLGNEDYDYGDHTDWD